MIILDTNVISEMMKSLPSLKVISWVDKQNANQLFITTITMAEIFYGLYALPLDHRRHLLENAFNKTIIEAFEYRILSFDEAASHSYGQLMANRKKMGKPSSILDGQISAIALTHGFAVATRNINDFSDCGLELIDPFD